MIEFDQIPNDIRVPGQYIEIDARRAVQGLPGLPTKLLVIGQRLSTGAVPQGVPTVIADAEAAAAAFGRGSMLHAMFRALRANNDVQEAWGIALDDDGAGVNASGSVLFAGTATAAGTVFLYIGGRLIRVGVAAGDTAADISAAAVAAITADVDGHVTAAVNGVTAEQADITARHAGTTGNDIDIRLNYAPGQALPAGITATVTPMADGATDPDIADAIAAIGDEWYTDIITPYTDSASLDALEAELAARFGPVDTKEAVAFSARTGTQGELSTFGGARNSPHVSVIGVDGALNPPWEWAGSYGGTVALAAAIDPARPFQTLPLAGILPPTETDRFTRVERESLLRDGISTWTATAGTVAIERAITQYRLNGQGAADTAFLDVNTMTTLRYLRWSQRNRIALKFPRMKLADDGTPVAPGQAIVTPATIRAELIALYREWIEAGLTEDMEGFVERLQVERDAGDANRVNVLMPPDLINQFRVFAARIEFRV